MTFSTWLRVKMAEHDINNSGLGRGIGVSQVSVGRWSRGDGIPTYKNCLKVARFFHIPEDEILEITGHRDAHIIGQSILAEPPPTYTTHPRPRLPARLDNLTDSQIEVLITLLESPQ